MEVSNEILCHILRHCVRTIVEYMRGDDTDQEPSLPPVSTIEGNITQIDKDGFTLTDNSGSIYVRAELPGNEKPNLPVDEKVKSMATCKAVGNEYLTRLPTSALLFRVLSSKA
jgi:hypothetical protein